jgi:hypothetical protein
MEEKYIQLKKYSNPTIVKKNIIKYFGKAIPLAVSTRKNKKYMLQDPQGRWIHFGQLPYSDYTKTGDDEKRRRYLQRSTKIKGDWASNPYSSNSLAVALLWNG